MTDALGRVAGYYRTHQPDIANRVLEGKKRAGSAVARSVGTLDGGAVDAILDAVKNAYDAEYGGFGSPPQFPQTDAIMLLLGQALLRSGSEVRGMATRTLERKGGGGTDDHLRGGF